MSNDQCPKKFQAPSAQDPKKLQEPGYNPPRCPLAPAFARISPLGRGKFFKKQGPEGQKGLQNYKTLPKTVTWDDKSFFAMNLGLIYHEQLQLSMPILCTTFAAPWRLWGAPFARLRLSGNWPLVAACSRLKPLTDENFFSGGEMGLMGLIRRIGEERWAIRRLTTDIAAYRRLFGKFFSLQPFLGTRKVPNTKRQAPKKRQIPGSKGPGSRLLSRYVAFRRLPSGWGGGRKKIWGWTAFVQPVLAE